MPVVNRLADGGFDLCRAIPHAESARIAIARGLPDRRVERMAEDRAVVEGPRNDRGRRRRAFLGFRRYRNRPVARVARQVIEEVLRFPDGLDVADEVRMEVGVRRAQVAEHYPLRPTLEIEVAPQREQALEAALDHDIDRPRPEAAIGYRHPAVGQIAVAGEEYAQRLVYAEQVSRAVDEVAAVGERLAFAIADRVERFSGESPRSAACSVVESCQWTKSWVRSRARRSRAHASSSPRAVAVGPQPLPSRDGPHSWFWFVANTTFTVASTTSLRKPYEGSVRHRQKGGASGWYTLRRVMPQFADTLAAAFQRILAAATIAIACASCTPSSSCCWVCCLTGPFPCS